jgi:hypothetical protein
MNTHGTDRLAGLIRRKHQVLVQLREFGTHQTNLIRGGDIASLLKLLAAKQQLISALQTLEGELRPFYDDDPERRSWSSTQARARCSEQAAECNALLHDIVELEKAGAEIMAVRRNEAAEQLQQAHAAAHVRSAYEAQRRAAV